VSAKRNIALARSMFENGNNHKELLKATKELYELRVSKLGEGNENTVKAGKRHAIGGGTSDKVVGY
jgi:hypothetical protein